MDHLRRTFALLLVAAAASCTSLVPFPLPSPPKGTPVPATRLSTVEQEVHDRINRHRLAAGLPPLSIDATLTSLARDHSATMAAGRQPFGHDGFKERLRTARTATGVARVGENVAMNNFPESFAARRVVDGWVASREHRGNLEGPFQVAGVGAARSPSGDLFVTQLYAAH